MRLVSARSIQWRYPQPILIAKIQKILKSFRFGFPYFRPYFGPYFPFVGYPIFPLWAALFSLCGLPIGPYGPIRALIGPIFPYRAYFPLSGLFSPTRAHFPL